MLESMVGLKRMPLLSSSMFFVSRISWVETCWNWTPKWKNPPALRCIHVRPLYFANLAMALWDSMGLNKDKSCFTGISIDEYWSWEMLRVFYYRFLISPQFLSISQFSMVKSYITHIFHIFCWVSRVASLFFLVTPFKSNNYVFLFIYIYVCVVCVYMFFPWKKSPTSDISTFFPLISTFFF